MLTIKFDDATIKRAIGAFCGKMAGSGFDRLADVFAAEANRQLTDHVAKCSGITDEELADALRKAVFPGTQYTYTWKELDTAGRREWLDITSRAREILAFAQPTAHVFEAGKSYLNKRGAVVPLEAINPPYGFYHFRGGDYVYGADGRIDRGSDSEFDLIPGAIDDAPAVDWKARAEKAEARLEKAEARLEKVREYTQRTLSKKPETEYERGMYSAWAAAAHTAGFRVIPEVPAQPLRVAACDE